MDSITVEKFCTKNRVDIEAVILKSLALAGLVGIVTLAVLAPNALQLLKYLDKDRKRKKNPKYLVDGALTRLVTKKYISISKSGQLFLTKEGERENYTSSNMAPILFRRQNGIRNGELYRLM